MSAAVGSDGRAWLWGFGTNSQLGNGNDDSDKEIPSLLKGKALQGKRVVQARLHFLVLSVQGPCTWLQARHSSCSGSTL